MQVPPGALELEAANVLNNVRGGRERSEAQPGTSVGVVQEAPAEHERGQDQQMLGGERAQARAE